VAGHQLCIEVELDLGFNFACRLGHGDEWPRWKPTQVAALASHHVTSVACGPAASAAVDYNGQLYLWGDNFCGQLFLNEAQSDGTVSELEVMKGVGIL
jgi:alpha-tubulin suppressor-like RCC1 family protein